MATTYDKASLVMIPSGVKESKLFSIKPTDGSGDFTFSRGADTATRVNASGLIEKETMNLLTYSNTFSNAAWTKSNTSVTGGQTGYDGSNDAWLLTKTGTAGKIAQNISSSGVNTFSVYAKANASNWIAVAFAPTKFAYFDLSSGSLGSAGTDIIDHNIEAVGATGWYRVSLSLVISTATFDIYVADADNDVSGTSGNIYIQDAQLNQGLVAQDYLETTTSAVYGGVTDNLPRLDYSGGASCPSLLLEPQRTNAIADSEFQGSGSTWYPSSTWSVEQNTSDTTSPEGLYNVVKLTETAVYGYHSGYYNSTIATSYTGNYTISCFAKYNGRFLVLSPKSASERTYFNLQTGVVAQNGTGDFVDADIEDYGNGWYRCWVTASFSSENVNFEHLLANAVGSLQYIGNGTDGVYMYGCQAEAGSYPTSYIPTYGTSASRSEDDNNALTSVSDLIGQTEGTLFVHTNSFISGITTLRKGYIYLNDGTFNNRIEVSKRGGSNISTSDDIMIRIVSGGVTQFDQKIVDDFSGELKLAVAYKNGDVAAYINGSSVYTNTGSVSIPATSQITIGNAYNEPLREPLKQALVFKTRLTNAELASLTQL